MNSQERITAMVEGEVPDRVPIYVPYYEPGFVEGFDNIHGDKIGMEDACICNRRDLTPLAYMGVDCCAVLGPPHLKTNDSPGLPIVDEIDSRVDMYGRIFKKEWSKGISFHVYQGPYLRTEEQIREWPFVNPPVVDPSWKENTYQEIVNCVDTHDVCPVFEGVSGLYSYLEQGIGKRNVAYLMHDDPGFIKLLLDRIFKAVIVDTRAVLDAGAAFVTVRDDVAQQARAKPQITPENVREFLLPYYKEIVEIIHAKGGKAFFETQGDVASLMDILLEARFDVIHVTEPDLPYLEEMKMTWGESCCLLGNIEASLLARGTLLQISKQVQGILRVTKDRGRFIIGTNDALLDSTPLSNLEEMLIVAKVKGKYT